MSEEIFKLPSKYEEDLKKSAQHHPHFSSVWTIGSIFSLLASLGSLLTMLAGGLWIIARLDFATKEIPDLLVTKNEQARQIAVLQDQQRYADSRYAEIMVQLTRINEKLDKQNEYLYDSFRKSSR